MQRLLLLFWLLAIPAARAQLAPAVTPLTVGLTDTLRSAILGEVRPLNIYLPEGYTASDTARYPVIYLLDGGLDGDFLPVVGVEHFSSFPWVGRLKPSIIVGIASTDRTHDFTPPTAFAEERALLPASGGAAAFIRFLKDELQPYVERQYRTAPSRTIIGESLGGLLAANILLTEPGLFDRYIIISPSLWWNDGALLKMPVPEPAATTDVYIGVGKEGATPGARPHIQEADARTLAERLQAARNPALRVQFDYLPAETHATVSHQALLNAFRLLARP